ncbi:MAG: T9SS type A sorting domain-containing protein [Bacteroidota bacterium]|nr:T9SS type A sorting domain-containing protein [Bacteroidota bacterium]
MKMKNLFKITTVVVLSGTIIGLFFFNTNEEKRHYIPQENNPVYESGFKGAAKWIHERRANQETGTVDIKDIRRAHAQITALQKKKSGLDLSWKDVGPTNIGGRTRAIVVDKNNPDIMYAGGVSGGLWMSTTAGLSWEQIHYEGSEYTSDFPNLAIASMCQAANGDIYFGTGEGHYKPYPAGTGKRGLKGAGIWKSTDGETFTHLESTFDTEDAQDAFSYVNKLAADPNNANRIFAATKGGLRLTEDGGQTWSNPVENIAGGPLGGFAGDVKISSNGNIVIANIGNDAYVSHDGGAQGTYEKVSGTEDNQISAAARLEFDIAPTNPNYIYCQASKGGGSLLNIYRSTDGGLNWEIIGQGGSTAFNPLGDQGTFDNVIAVFPDNEDEIIVGGQLNVWKWQHGGNWTIKSSSYVEETSTYYVHADQHAITFHPNNPDIVYIGCDGGIYRSLDRGNTWESLNKNYNITQFYAIGHGPDGSIIGGTQDNGSLLYDPDQIITDGTAYPYYEVSGGDGGYAAISQIKPNIIFSTVYYGSLYRSEEQGEDATMFPFYDGRVTSEYTVGEQGEANFVTPIALWESFYDVNSKDSVEFVLSSNTPMNTTVQVPSETSSDLNMTWTADQFYMEGDTISIPDRYQAALAVGFNGTVFVTREPLNFKEDPAPWFPVAYNVGMVETMEWDAKGENLFVANNNGSLYRISGFENAYADSLLDADHTSFALTKTRIANFPNRYITGIAVDPSDANKVVVTLGQFGNPSNIYYSTEALTADETSSSGTFEDKQGDLPQMPLYDAIIVWDNGNRVIVGSEYGIFATNFIGAITPSWTDETNGADYTAVYDMTQQIFPNGYNHDLKQFTPVKNHGHIWAGTHGRGIFLCDKFEGPVGIEPGEELANQTDSKLNIYPNPASNILNAEFSLDSPGNVTLKVYDINGRLMKQRQFNGLLKGHHNKSINVSNLSRGTYIIHIDDGNHVETSRLVVN